MNKLKIAVIGAGAAGMMAAIAAADNAEVTVFEKNDKPGKKLFITGKGRCNVTNDSDMDQILLNIVTNRKFLYSALYDFTNKDVENFFEKNGVPLKVERGNRVFPESDRSADIISALKHAMKEKHVFVNYNTEVKNIIVEDGAACGIVLDSKKKIYFDKIIIATGGASYPVTGSDGYGMTLLEKNGHTVKPLRPALVPMNAKEEFVKDLQGLSLKNINVTFYQTGKRKALYDEFGEMMFTHFGVTGPVILSASSVIGKKLKDDNLMMSIDLKTALSREKLDERILRDFKENINKDFRNSLDKLLPKSIIPVIISLSGIDQYKKVNEISKEERLKLLELIKNFRLTITSLRGMNEAIITSGGINVKEINPGTMESKIIRNLYICGEMIDVDALTGGYNLQIAWSTGNLAGRSASEVE